MAFVTTRQYQELLERVEKLEEKLTGGETYAEVSPPVVVETSTLEVPTAPADEEDPYQEMVDLVGKKYAALLKSAGFNSVEELKNSPAGDLTAVSGIGPAVVKKIKGEDHED